jgi:hypothetical protein
MGELALLEEILANQKLILAALDRGGLLPAPRVQQDRELSDAQRLAKILTEHGRKAYKPELEKRRKGNRYAAERAA